MPLRWGIIGCGAPSYDFVRSMSRCERPHVVVAVASQYPDRLREFVDSLSLSSAKTYGDFSELISNSNVEIVYIDLFNDAHITWALKALKSGKNVLCEKPLALNSKQVRLVVDTALNCRRFLMESFWSRFFPSWRSIRSIIQTSQLGTLRIFHSNLGCGPISELQRDLSKGETPLLSVGIYTIGLALYVFEDEKPQRIVVIGDSRGTDRWANITLEFAFGRHAFLYYNAECFSPTSAFLSFDHGQIQIPKLFWCPDKYTILRGKLKNADIEDFEFPLNDKTKYNFANGAGIRFQTDHIAESIRSGRLESSIMPLASSIVLAETLEEIRRQLGVFFPQD